MKRSAKILLDPGLDPGLSLVTIPRLKTLREKKGKHSTQKGAVPGITEEPDPQTAHRAR